MAKFVLRFTPEDATEGVLTDHPDIAPGIHRWGDVDEGYPMSTLLFVCDVDPEDIPRTLDAKLTFFLESTEGVAMAILDAVDTAPDVLPARS